MKVIALEEHYWDREVAGHFTERGPEMRIPALQERLYDLGALRLKEMDEAGIDLQVLSHGAPATQRLDAATARSRRSVASARDLQILSHSVGWSQSRRIDPAGSELAHRRRGRTTCRDPESVGVAADSFSSCYACSRRGRS